MTDTNQKQLGNTLWSIADQLRVAIDAGDFLEVLKTHKKGLMQQLFPSPEEVEA